MASSRLKSYGIAAGLAAVTASGIVGMAVLALGVTLPQCSPDGAGPASCAPEELDVMASVATAAPVLQDAQPAAVQPASKLPAKNAVGALPRRDSPGVEAAAAAVMADEIAMASISVTPARVAAAAKPAPAREKSEAVPAAAPKVTPLPVPEPLAPTSGLEEQEAAAEAAVASELAVVPTGDATIAGDAVNVRATPSTSGERLYVFTEGTAVTPAGQSRGWAKIADAEGRSGWVDARLLANVDLAALPVLDPPPETAPEAAPAGKFRTVTGSGVNVRSGPSGESGTLFALAGGTKVEVTGEDKGWLSIVDPEGRSGWAYSDYLD